MATDMSAALETLHRPNSTGTEVSKIRLLKTGQKAEADPSPLAIHRLMEDHLARNPVIDKDAIEEELSAIKSSADPLLIEQARSGNPWETVQAMNKIKDQSEEKKEIESMHSQRLEDAVEEIKDAKKDVGISISDKAIAKLRALMEHVMGGKFNRLTVDDIESSFHQIREDEQDARRYNTRDEASARQLLQATKPMLERLEETK